MKTSSKALLAVLSVVVVAAIVSGVVYYRHNKKTAAAPAGNAVVAKVGTHSILASDLTPYLATATNRSAALDCLMRDTLYRDLSTKYNAANVSPDQWTNQYAVLGINQDSVTAYQQLCVHADLAMANVQMILNGSIAGKIVIANFDQHLPSSERGGNPGMPSLVAGDKAYANSLITNLYSAVVTTKRTTMDQAIASELTDAKVGSKTLATSIQSGTFSTGATPSSGLDRVVINSSRIMNALATLQPGGITTVITLQDNSDSITNTSGPRDAAYVFAQLTSRTESGKITFDEAVAAEKKIAYEVKT